MNFASSRTPNLGLLGEQLVAQWLQSQDWIILHHRWRCRWGEIDLIAQLGEMGRGGDLGVGGVGEISSFPSYGSTLAFVEVKTRGKGNWDADGLLAITPAKQAKLWQTAALFLAERPDFASLPCRFDVALVNSMRLPQRWRDDDTNASDSSLATSNVIQLPAVQLGQPVFVAGYQLILQDYLVSAFDIQEG
ncbi:MAG: YraN family protein [Potamolinea sp.]